MKNVQDLENPLFLSKSVWQYGNYWALNGFSFTADGGKKYALYQIFSVFGSYHRGEIHADWKLFQIDENGIFKEINNFLLECVIESLELTAEEVDVIVKHSKSNLLHPKNAESQVVDKVMPLITNKINFVKEAFVKIDQFNEDDLVGLTKKVDVLLSEIKDLYPRSYEKLFFMKVDIKKQYAKIKYPELYSELEKVKNDKQYKADGNDDIVGFGYRSVFGCYNDCFGHYSLMPEDIHRLHSPFEYRITDSVFFKE